MVWPTILLWRLQSVAATCSPLSRSLPKRMARHGLTVHPEKTRLVDFRSPGRSDPNRDPRRDGEPKGKSFDFLGFTHHWGLSRRGYWVVKRKTARNRWARASRAIWEWCRGHRHDPLIDQAADLGRKLRGHYAYYGITGNFHSLRRFWTEAKRTWRYWLGRRRRDGAMGRERFDRVAAHYRLPEPRIVHRYGGLVANPS